MLGPQLPKNRAEHDRYTKMMLHAIWVFPVGWLALVVLLFGGGVLLGSGPRGMSRIATALNAAALAGLFTCAVFMGYCEVNKVLIFRRDLRERRTSLMDPEHGDPDRGGEPPSNTR